MIGKGHPFSRLLRRLEAGYHTFREADAGRDFGPAWVDYKAAGYVARTAAARAVPCPACDGDARPVTYLRPELPAIRCPTCGLVTLTMMDVARARLDVPALLGAVGAAAGTAGAPTEAAPGVWRLGPIRTGVRSADAFVAATLDRGRLTAAAPVLARRKTSVLFFPTPAGLSAWTGAGPVVAALTEYLDADGAAVRFDAAAFAALVRAETAPAPAPLAPKKRAARAEKIERLTAALTDHLLVARAHALATRRRDGVAELTPRPTQRALARRLGLSEAAVFRCLKKDRSKGADVLRLLWRTAADVDAVTGWRAPAGG